MTVTKRRGSWRSLGVAGYGDIGTSLVFIFPLFIAYQVGVAFAPAGNGVDFVTGWLFAAVGRDRDMYLLLNLGFGLVFVALIVYLRRQRAIALHSFLPMAILSGIYALTLGSFILFVMDKLLGFDGVMALDAGSALVVSLGAGVYEELVFRLGLLAGSAYILRALGLPHGAALVIALAGSSAVFSAAHHLGASREQFSTVVFTYRMLAGAIFGVIFYFQSLAHAVYTHFFYDAYVLLLHPAAGDS